MKKYFGLRSAFLFGFSLVIFLGASSCVPIAIGAAGAAAGYIARDQGVGVVEPIGSGSSSGAYDEPVY
jgi:hypothetical protein